MQTSTIGIEATERCAEAAEQAGLVLVDAPVLGTKKPAEEGQLVILGSGPEEAASDSRPSSEMLALAEAIGVDPQAPLEAIADGPLDLPYLRLKAKAMLEEDFTPSFRLSLAAKDAGLALAAAEWAGLELPVLEAIRQSMDAVAREHGDEDLAAVYRASSDGDRRRSTAP